MPSLSSAKLLQNANQDVDRLLPEVYSELQKIAHAQLNRMWNLETINTTVLVHEVYLKLAASKDCQFVDRAHFLALASKAMRHILINYAEKKLSQKRGGLWKKVTLEEALNVADVSLDTFLEINKGLVKLEELDPKLASLVEMRFYAGLTEGEIADVQGVSERTVRRNWRKAKAMLAIALQ